MMSISEVPVPLRQFVKHYTALCTPKEVYWVNGSKEEYDLLCEELVVAGTFVKLNQEKRPGCFLARSDPADVARVEKQTFICSENEEDAGPTNNWADPAKMKSTLSDLYRGCMAGRTMYVIPFSMGPIGSRFSKLGVQLTDSAYVVVNMYIMARIGNCVLEQLSAMVKKEESSSIGSSSSISPPMTPNESFFDAKQCEPYFLPCVHSVGSPLEVNKPDVPWPCNNASKYICHFPQDPLVMSFGSGYGGNALLGKKCFALRIASVMGRKEGWLAEHCLILSIEKDGNGPSPSKSKKYNICAGFPSACGKTNLAMLKSEMPGWTVRCIGDDIAWIRPDPETGKLHALNPEAGFFGVAPGTSTTTNPSAMATMTTNTIFTNVALTQDKDVWWEGLTKTPPENLTDWKGMLFDPSLKQNAAHPNSRYTTPAGQCPVIDKEWENPNGVPLDAIIFGGRRSDTVPLVTEARNWEHGVLLGSLCSSEQTAAAEGVVGTLRIDPFAMLPFCGYNMGDYFSHWLDVGSKLTPENTPRIFYVNWFRRDENRNFLWPGFGENMRVLKWMCDRIDGTAKAIETPVGNVPADLDIAGLDITEQALSILLKVDAAKYLNDIPQFEEHLARFTTHLPTQLRKEFDLQKMRLNDSLESEKTLAA